MTQPRGSGARSMPCDNTNIKEISSCGTRRGGDQGGRASKWDQRGREGLFSISIGLYVQGVVRFSCRPKGETGYGGGYWAKAERRVIPDMGRIGWGGVAHGEGQHGWRMRFGSGDLEARRGHAGDRAMAARPIASPSFFGPPASNCTVVRC